LTETILWQPQAGPQTALLSCPVFEVFFGGARGGGKTDGMLGDWINHADIYQDNAIGLMVRRQRTELMETIERSRQLYLPLGGKFHEQDKYWRFPNGARLRFAYLERDADADSYQGHSYSRVYVEEIGNFPSRAPIAKLLATLRSGAGVPVGFRATGNPGGPGHTWVKARYIDPCPAGWKPIHEEFTDPWTGTVVSRDRVYIPSKLQDNKFLGSEYVANLQMVGSMELVRAWLEGDWDVVEGAFFDTWSHRKHIVRPFPIPVEWLRFRSMDWGYASPASIGWWAVVGDDYAVDGRTLPRGCLVRYREWYVADGPNKGLRLDAERIAAGIRDRERGEKIAYGVLDPAAFSEDGGPSIAERMARAGVRFRPADNRRVAKKGAIGGWDTMRARLRGQDDVPMLVCFDTCVDSIRTIPVLQHDRDKAEDLDTDAEDHAADEWRYACMSRPWLPRAVEADKPKAKSLNEMTFNELWALKDDPKRIRV
jgi:hypothetical protein